VSARIEIPGIVLGEELGSGAYSVVHRGLQNGIPCAVKLPRTKGRWSRWVYREAVALARVRHPALPKVLEVGEIDEWPYLVMELVEGETLDARLRRSPFTEDEVFELVLLIADALEAVHAVGLVHRDVKPRNILVEPSGNIRLVDFGFAIPMDRARQTEPAGTPGYAAPEQLLMPARVDRRADLYALGRVILECARLGSAASLSTELGAIARVLIAPEPENRYPTARALATEIRNVRAGGSVLGPHAFPKTDIAAPIVGRENERRRIVQAWSEVGDNGAVVVIRGVRGSGKSHLLDVVAAEVGALDAFVLRARCGDGDAPLAVLRNLYEGIMRAGDEVGTAVLRSATGNNLASIAILIAPKIAKALGESPTPVATTAEAFAEGAAEILVRVGREVGRVVIAVDDVQWMDPASRDVLARLAARVHETPVLMLLATRDGVSGATNALTSLLPKARLSVIELAPLSLRKIETLVGLQLGAEDAIDGAAVRRIASLADGTPLGVIEVLGAFLDAGAVRPHEGKWLFDEARVDRVALPRGALSLLGRRVADLPPATRRVLETAALLGTQFDIRLLAQVLELTSEDLAFALDDAHRAGLVHEVDRERHCFVHDSLREMVVAGVAPEHAVGLHQRIAETLDAERPTTIDGLCMRALHFERGLEERAPHRRYHAARDAAVAVFERFDNERAVRFFDVARKAAAKAGIALDLEFFVRLGDAQLRLGALEDSLRSYESALALADERAARAEVLGRVAWVHQTRADADRSWSTLALAFNALGVSLPIESAGSGARTLRTLAKEALKKIRPSRAISRSPVELAVLCDLHIQNVRLGTEYMKPLRSIQSTIEVGHLSATLQPSRTLARALLFHGFVMSVLGRTAAGGDELARGRRMAIELGDPVVGAFGAQLDAVACGWSGRLDVCLDRVRECLEVHGHWYELNEYCQLAATAEHIETVRGRPTEAWECIARAIERLRRSPPETTEFAAYVFHRARAVLAAMGSTVQDDPWLEQHLRTATTAKPRSLYQRIMTWGPRMRALVETGDVGSAFDALCAEFEREGHRPRFAHPGLSEYFLAVAHGRIHQCLRAPPSDRFGHLPRLRVAAANLKAVSRSPLFRGHRLLVDAHIAWFSGAMTKARSLLIDAGAVAELETCTWVLYGIARARAHMLREEGRLDAARDQARIAEALAVGSGAQHRARFIRDEFTLTKSSVVARRGPVTSAHGSVSHRARKQLTSFLNIVGAPQPGLDVIDHAATVLDNLIADLGADEALLEFNNGTHNRVVLGRDRNGDSFGELGERQKALLAGNHSPKGESDLRDDKRVLIAALFLYDENVGTLCLQRAPTDPPFASDERELFELVSHQVPIALEMARLLGDRVRLEAALQQAKKMEALGELAGGVAHDFNNMLTIVRGALEVLEAQDGLGSDVKAELDVINESVERAVHLTRQLLGFSRHQPASLQPVDVMAGIGELRPMLERIAGKRVDVVLKLEPVSHIQIDRAAFDQALVNLTLNARDAMPDGGTLTISIRELSLDEESSRTTTMKPGSYVVVEVADTGIGMDAEVASRAFDPFFTTKRRTGGTGLGLSTVYAFTKNSGGYVNVASEVGSGTSFRLFFPRAAAAARSSVVVEPPRASTPKLRDDHAILVVDDDRAIRESLRRVLHRAGYRVFSAGGAVDALDIVRRCAAEISLVVLDVMMPGMSGPELARELAALELPAPVLFISGYAPGDLPVGIGQVTAQSLLQKPFGGDQFLERVAALVQA
jgi:eukaryotic-like serine/threonine-protein kinase